MLIGKNQMSPAGGKEECVRTVFHIIVWDDRTEPLPKPLQSQHKWIVIFRVMILDIAHALTDTVSLTGPAF